MPPMPRPVNGPYIAVATFCEKVLRESDNVLTIVRVVDTLNIAASGTDVPDQLPPVPITNLTIAIVLRRGEARGRHRIQVRPEDPAGTHRDAVADTFIQLGGDQESGANILFDITGFPVDQEGLWWFDVLFGDATQLITRIPLKVNYSPQSRPA